jgi:hypothetical protein
MIENLSAIPTFSRAPPMMSTVDVTYAAWGPIGPVIYFRPELCDNCDPHLDQMENSLTGAR